jgi:hypothetical protein
MDSLSVICKNTEKVYLVMASRRNEFIDRKRMEIIVSKTQKHTQGFESMTSKLI